MELHFQEEGSSREHSTVVRAGELSPSGQCPQVGVDRACGSNTLNHHQAEPHAHLQTRPRLLSSTSLAPGLAGEQTTSLGQASPPQCPPALGPLGLWSQEQTGPCRSWSLAALGPSISQEEAAEAALTFPALPTSLH